VVATIHASAASETGELEEIIFTLSAEGDMDDVIDYMIELDDIVLK
jgi:hypothetical protein